MALSWDSAQNVADFVSKYSDGSYPVVLGTNNLAADFKIESFPSFYFLDKDGNYSSSAASYVTSFGIWWRVQMAKNILKLKPASAGFYIFLLKSFVTSFSRCEL